MKADYIKKVLSLPSVEAAPFLLGCELVRVTPHGQLKLRIVEVEAYHQDDAASHSYRGNTKRTAPMFKRGGHIYVYFTYGMHYCVNIVTGQEGVGEGVLLRAGEPIEGVEVMRRYRGTEDTLKLASGPGRLAQALGIKDTSLSGKELGDSTLKLLPPSRNVIKTAIMSSPRIGIRLAADLPWRFYLKDSPYVSKSVKV